MDNKHNKLDDFLRDQLNDSSENPSWNVPGDHVFENAMKALPRKENNNRRGWLLIPLLFLIVIIGRELMHKNEIDTLENKITSLENNISSNFPGNNDSDTNTTETLNHFTETAEETSESKNISSGTHLTGPTYQYTAITIEREYPAASETNQKAQRMTETKSFEIAQETETHNISLADRSSIVVEMKSTAVESSSTLSFVNEHTYVPLSKDKNGQDYPTPDRSKRSITPFLPHLPLSGVTIKLSMPEMAHVSPVLQAQKSPQINPLRYGVLIGGNRSRLTMKNIPSAMEAKLYAYDNSQPGAGAYAFVEKPLSKKLTIQTGIGYQYYQNKSILEENFLFTDDYIVVSPDGKEFYEAPIDVINPLGDYSTMLAFRVSDQMHENDILSEFTTMKQELHVVHLDISLGYTILSTKKFALLMGGGLGIGYLAGLQNDFNVSSYHNGQLQSSRSEAPKKLNDTQKWYGQAIGKMTIEYHLTTRLSLLLESQYRGGISSLRRGTEMNGSQTYLQSIGITAGFSQSF